MINEFNLDDGLESDINHLVKSISGYCGYSAIDEEIDKNDISYFRGLLKANGIIHGNEAKELTAQDKSSVASTLKQIISDIESFFSGEGSTQLSEARDNYKTALNKMSAVGASTKIDSKSHLLSKTKYFKRPSLEYLKSEEYSFLSGYSEKISSILERLNTVNTLGKLILIYNEIQKVVLEAANKITNLIFSTIGKLHTILESTEVDLKLAKRKTKELQRLAKLRNAFLAPCFVIAGSLPNVETLKNNNQ